MFKRNSDYKTAQPPKNKYEGRKPVQKEAPPKGGSKDDNGFHRITNLFPSKAGKSYTVFLKPDMLEVLSQSREGDLLGVSQNEGEDTIRMWLKTADEG